MIKAKIINVCENMTYDDVTIYTPDEQIEMGMPNLFEDGQICFKDRFGKKYLCDNNMIGNITLRSMTPQRDCLKVTRITVTWHQIVFAPAWIVLPNRFEYHGIPNIFPGLKQFCFVADGELHVTKDDRVALVEFD